MQQVVSISVRFRDFGNKLIAFEARLYLKKAILGAFARIL